MRKKIVVAGSSNTDMVVKVPHIPAPGETVMGSELLTIPGGKGANQAVAAARAGGKVVFVTCVSDDTFGLEAIENYSKDGIDTTFIKTEPGIHSGVALINVADDGENSISVAPGANNYLLPDDIMKSKNAFHDAAIVLVQLEIPLKTVEAIIETGASLNIPVILNPAPGMKLPAELLKKISVITPNESEAAIITGREKTDNDNIDIIARDIRKMGVNTVLITLGSRGVYLVSDKFEGIIPGYKVRAIDTTAAGDIFNGTLAMALSEGVQITEAIDYAQRAAAISVTRTGAQPSAPYHNEISDYSF